jgi:hypothetical protein
MEEISKLNKFTFPFQLLGLQNFSLKESPNLRYPKRVFYVVILLMIFIAVSFFLTLVEDVIRLFLTETNFVNMMVVFVFMVNYFTIIFFAVTFTVCDHLKLERFFVKFRKVLELFGGDFNFSALE